MSQSLARIIFESSPLNSFWSAWFAGFCFVGADGCVYRTAAGQAYLDERDAN